MFKSLLISLFAILLFTMGGAASWFYVQMVAEQSADEETPGPPALFSQEEADPVPAMAPSSDPRRLGAILTGPDLDGDELFRLSTAAKAKQEQLAQYEEKLREHKLRIKAADADTKTAQREVEGTLNQVRSLMTAIETLMGETKITIGDLQKERAKNQQKADALQEMEKEAGAGVTNNVKNFAEILKSMPPVAAAGALKEMINDGKMDFVIQLLRKIEARNVSKILAEIDDLPLVAELAARYPEAPHLR